MDMVLGNKRINHANFDQGLPPVVRTSVCGTNSKAHDQELARRKGQLAGNYFAKRYGPDYFGSFVAAKTGVDTPIPPEHYFSKPSKPMAQIPTEILLAIAEPIDIYSDESRNRKSLADLVKSKPEEQA